jgi:hypothetical protein
MEELQPLAAPPPENVLARRIAAGVAILGAGVLAAAVAMDHWWTIKGSPDIAAGAFRWDPHSTFRIAGKATTYLAMGAALATLALVIVGELRPKLFAVPILRGIAGVLGGLGALAAVVFVASRPDPEQWQLAKSAHLYLVGSIVLLCGVAAGGRK